MENIEQDISFFKCQSLASKVQIILLFICIRKGRKDLPMFGPYYEHYNITKTIYTSLANMSMNSLQPIVPYPTKRHLEVF